MHLSLCYVFSNYKYTKLRLILCKNCLHQLIVQIQMILLHTVILVRFMFIWNFRLSIDNKFILSFTSVLFINLHLLHFLSECFSHSHYILLFIKFLPNEMHLRSMNHSKIQVFHNCKL